MKKIASRENSHFKYFKRLADNAQFRKREGKILLDGVHLAQVYLSQVTGSSGTILVSSSGLWNSEVQELIAQRSAAACDCFELSDQLFNLVSPVDTPSGILVVAHYPSPADLPSPSVDSVLLDGVQDPGNVGSIIRSASAAGFRQIILGQGCAQAWSPKVLRSAMGGHFHVSIYENMDLLSFTKSFEGLSVATVLYAHTRYDELGLNCPVAWIFGSEGDGVSSDLAAAAAISTTIPMFSELDSLNVAAAGAICLFETCRQRRNN